jgi:hypothetical protein
MKSKRNTPSLHCFAVLFVMLAGIYGCKDEPDLRLFDFEEQFILRTTEEGSCRQDNMIIRVINIFDSRCPIGVVCFWQGEAVVGLEIQTDTAFNLTLRSVFQPADTLYGYVFRLVDVQPYPVNNVNVPASQKKVILEVSKQ